MGAPAGKGQGARAVLERRRRLIRYPKGIHIQGVEPLDCRSIFVENGGVRIDNAGPFPLKEAVKLWSWLGRYIAAEESRRGR